MKKVRLTRAEQNAKRSDELLDAAWALFCEKGYEAVTIDAVAAHAGYSRMPIYSLFGDKQMLFFALWRRAIDNMLQALLGDLSGPGPLRRKLQKLAKVIELSSRAQPGAGEHLFFVVQTIALSRPEIEDQLQALSRDVIERFVEMIKAATLAPGETLRGSAETVAAHLVAHINGLSTVRFQTGRSYAITQNLAPLFVAIAFKSGA